MAVIFGPTSWAVRGIPLGTSLGGSGFLICKSGGVAWIVAPSTTEVIRTWYCRNDAVTTAQSTTGCTGWFVPTCGQLSNPGYACRTYWDSYNLPSGPGAVYYSSTENNVNCAIVVNFAGAAAGNIGPAGLKCINRFVRAFRCVTY